MKFDVFLSFREIDTRRTFVSHLCLSLFKKRIRFFGNDERRPASSQVLQSIEESKAAIVVISKNFASSVSCLDELVKIMECREKSSTTSLFLVVPVFYDIDPSDVLRQADNLQEEHGGGDNLDLVDKWRDALTKFTRTFGHFLDWELEDSYIIDRVTDYISEHVSAGRSQSKQGSESLIISRTESNELRVLEYLRRATDRIHVLNESERLRTPRTETYEYMYRVPIRVKPRLRSSVNVTDNDLCVTSSKYNSLVGMDQHIKAVDTLLLDLDSKDGVGKISIWGVRGVGKSTLVRCVYEQISLQFQDHCYVMNDTSNYSLGRRESSCLLEEITRAALETTSGSVTRNCDVVKAKFGHRKVLLIVDSVDQIAQLNNINLIASWLGPRSRLILVTQDKSLLLESGISHLYEVEPLNYDEALQLFSQFAFKDIHVPRGFDRLSARAIFITGHIPLALKVFGSFLFEKDIKQWEFELLRLEASQENWISLVSSYIGGDFYRRQPTIIDGYIGGEDDEGEEFPSYCFALG